MNSPSTWLSKEETAAKDSYLTTKKMQVGAVDANRADESVK